MIHSISYQRGKLTGAAISLVAVSICSIYYASTMNFSGKNSTYALIAATVMLWVLIIKTIPMLTTKEAAVEFSESGIKPRWKNTISWENVEDIYIDSLKYVIIEINRSLIIKTKDGKTIQIPYVEITQEKLSEILKDF